MKKVASMSWPGEAKNSKPIFEDNILVQFFSTIHFRRTRIRGPGPYMYGETFAHFFDHGDGRSRI